MILYSEGYPRPHLSALAYDILLLFNSFSFILSRTYLRTTRDILAWITFVRSRQSRQFVLKMPFWVYDFEGFSLFFIHITCSLRITFSSFDMRWSKGAVKLSFQVILWKSYLNCLKPSSLFLSTSLNISEASLSSSRRSVPSKLRQTVRPYVSTRSLKWRFAANQTSLLSFIETFVPFLAFWDQKSGTEPLI